MDMEELSAYGNNLIGFLKEEKDFIALNHFLRQSEALRYQCGQDFNHTQKTIQGYREKINVNKLIAAAVESECVADPELDLLQKEWEEKERIEHMLRGELRGTVDEIDDLEGQQVSFEDQRQTVKKLEQDELRARMQLSMYASVTNIIPCLNDQSKISGHILERNKKLAKKFEFDQAKFTAFETCRSLWRMTSL